MDPRPLRRPSREAKDAFAALLARVEAGEELDLAAEVRAHALAGELAGLHERWRRLQGTFAALDADSEALDSVEDQAREALDPAAGARREELRRAFATRSFEERYEPRGRLGRGGMGVVERVFDRVLQREVAAKRLRRSSSSALRRFLDEARVVAGLDHPGLVPVLDAGLDARGRAWFTMPLVQGTSLAVVLALVRDQSGGWTRERALGVLLAVCETVAYAHARGIVHRDLKPANVMVGEFGEVHVLDWGLALLAREDEGTSEAPTAVPDTQADADANASADADTDPHASAQADANASADADLNAHADAATSARPHAHRTRHGALLGTPAYMPPEQAAGRRELVGPACDVYAIGALLYHLLAGRAPYAEIGPSNDAVARAVLAGPPVALALVAPRASAELVAIAEKAMAREPRERYADVRALAGDLRAFLEGRVVRAHESGAWAELRKWTGRNRALAGALAVIVLVCGLALALALWSERARRVELVRLSDARLLDVLAAGEDALWPATPARLGAIEDWIAEAETLAARLPQHQSDLDALRARAQGVDAGGQPRFAAEEDEWRFGALTALVENLSGFQARLASTRARLARAKLVGEQSLVLHAEDWRRAADALTRVDGPYRGLVLRPQFGLVPLGPDPEGGLWLFADLDTGKLPARDASGALELGPESALVLLLVPGGTATIGSLRPELSPAEGDPQAREHEFPRRTLELAPFFLAKYELTQAQWSRLAGSNPSYLPVGAAANPAVRAQFPVDTVAWDECARVLAQAGLALPTEAQWEYAARGGTSTRWWCGSDARSLAGRVNAALEDGSARESWEVGSGAPNAWGFHHVLGNVAEWVRDGYTPDHAGPLRAGDGEAELGGRSLRLVRGGSFLSPAAELRCAARDEQSPGTRSAWIGVRPSRMLEP